MVGPVGLSRRNEMVWPANLLARARPSWTELTPVPKSTSAYSTQLPPKLFPRPPSRANSVPCLASKLTPRIELVASRGVPPSSDDDAGGVGAVGLADGSAGSMDITAPLENGIAPYVNAPRSTAMAPTALARDVVCKPAAIAGEPGRSS